MSSPACVPPSRGQHRPAICGGNVRSATVVENTKMSRLGNIVAFAHHTHVVLSRLIRHLGHPSLDDEGVFFA